MEAARRMLAVPWDLTGRFKSMFPLVPRLMIFFAKAPPPLSPEPQHQTSPPPRPSLWQPSKGLGSPTWSAGPARRLGLMLGCCGRHMTENGVDAGLGNPKGSSQMEYVSICARLGYPAKHWETSGSDRHVFMDSVSGRYQRQGEAQRKAASALLPCIQLGGGFFHRFVPATNGHAEFLTLEFIWGCPTFGGSTASPRSTWIEVSTISTGDLACLPHLIFTNSQHLLLTPD